MGSWTEVCFYFIDFLKHKIFIKFHILRNNSEKLAIKIREQATAIVHLNTEKEKYIQDIEILQQQLKKITHDLENSAYDKEKIKVSFNIYFWSKKISDYLRINHFLAFN